MPYVAATVTALPGTSLIAILPSRFVALVKDPELKVVAAPPQFDEFSYGVAWNPRLDADPLHVWLRELVIDACSRLETQR